MEDAVTKARREAMEAEDKVKELVPEKKEQEAKKSRYVRRLEQRKQDMLNTMINLFFTQRSALKDPDGPEADALFVHLRSQWHKECRCFNGRRAPFQLKYTAFADTVEFYLKKENEQKVISKVVNQYKDYAHWKRRAHVWRTLPFISLLFFVKTLRAPEKREQLWKNWYVKNILSKDGTN